MKYAFYKVLSNLAIIGFLLYWTGIFLLAMPPNLAKDFINAEFPRFKNSFGFGWKLFTVPHTAKTRLYFIVRDSSMLSRTDTIEVLEQIAIEKQQAAPFNQRENIIDHLVNNNVSGLLNVLWSDKNLPSADRPETMDSFYVATAITAAQNSRNYQVNLATLTNYCRYILKEHDIPITGKAVKMLIKGKTIPPYKINSGAPFIEKELLYFESPFEHLYP